MSLNIKMSLTSSSEYKQGRGKYRGKASLFRIRIKSALFNCCISSHPALFLAILC